MVLNVRPVVKVLSAVTAVVGASMLLPLFVALCYGEYDCARAFAFCAIPLILAGVAAIRSTPRADNDEIRMKDGFFIVAVAWLGMSALSALPFMITRDIPNFVDAFFEMCSGYSTTGSTILTDIEALHKSTLFWRSFTHFLGGMGVLVLTIALLPMLGIGGQKIMRAETTGPTMDKATFTTTGTAKILYSIYTGMTVLQILLLKIGGMSLYDACVQAFGTMGTGGFSNYAASIGAFHNLYFEIVIMVFMTAAGVNFGLYAAVLSGRPEKLLQDRELRTYLGILAGSMLFIAAVLTLRHSYPNFFTSLRYSSFQVVSIMTTTGFATVDFDLWPLVCKLVLYLLMFVGGCAGSTGGGVKVIRVILLFKLVRRAFDRLRHPKALAPIKVGGKSVAPETLSGVAGFLLLYAAIAAASTLLITLQGVSLLTASSSVIACLSNIGPGFELVGPVMNFAFYAPAAKLLLSLLMIIGRLELFTVVLLFIPEFWNKNR